MALNADILKLTNANDVFHPSSPIAVDLPVRNAHTGWMIPTITLKTLHIILLVIWYSANTEDRQSCNAFSDMVSYPL